MCKPESLNFRDFLNCESCQASNETYAIIATGLYIPSAMIMGAMILSYILIILDSMDDFSLIFFTGFLVLFNIWLFVVVPCPIYVWCGFCMCNAYIKSAKKTRDVRVRRNSRHVPSHGENVGV